MGDMNKNRKLSAGSREVARLFAVQVFYCSEMLEKSIAEVLKDNLKQEVVLDENVSINDISTELLDELIKAYVEHTEEIDKEIAARLSQNWTIERLNKVVLAILRLGVAELLYMTTPPTVVFNEYIEISKTFFKKSDVSFINGLLNAVYQDNSKK